MIQNIFRNMYNRTKGDQTIVEVAQIEPEEEQHLFLPIIKKKILIRLKALVWGAGYRFNKMSRVPQSAAEFRAV